MQQNHRILKVYAQDTLLHFITNSKDDNMSEDFLTILFCLKKIKSKL